MLFVERQSSQRWRSSKRLQYKDFQAHFLHSVTANFQFLQHRRSEDHKNPARGKNHYFHWASFEHILIFRSFLQSKTFLQRLQQLHLADLNLLTKVVGSAWMNPMDSR